MTRTLVALAHVLPALAPTQARAGNSLPPGPCCTLSEEARAAVTGVIPVELLNPGMSVCGTGSYIPVEVLLRNRAEALPCLVDIYWHGLTVPSLCGKGERADGRWTFWYIRLLDEPLAVGILETEAHRSPQRRIGLLAQLVLLGELRYVGELLDFMENHAGPATDYDHLLDVLSAIDAREALPRLRALRDGSPGQNVILAALIAQLERDPGTLVTIGVERPEHSRRILGLLDMIGAEDEALELLGHMATRPMTAVSAGNEIAERRKQRRGNLLLRAHLVSPVTVTLGDPVEVEVTLQNVSHSLVELPHESYVTLRILTVVPKMHALAWRTPPRTPAFGTRRSLAPGERVVLRIRADQNYDFDRPGLYGITATLDCHGTDSWAGHLEAAWFEVNVRAPSASPSVPSRETALPATSTLHTTPLAPVRR